MGICIFYFCCFFSFLIFTSLFLIFKMVEYRAEITGLNICLRLLPISLWGTGNNFMIPPCSYPSL